ncbi:MAG: chloride channel protein [Lentimicrobium sp.]|jgi:CIC family chloride channel protein|nr:chloride channel protein [Lentimicrobium sp.]MDD2529370.1 chloride channel protein [Lentimicrobiaceae bacterium]MDD4599095.1 chloride channel protein [Lentimicrobiaceae bacterium]MDY0027055.1 chloride channel protein [Lentimicrobium sp.]HAH57991.1 chloride channel protein [Bacteroidales bacterium]
MKFNTLLVRFNSWRAGRISQRNIILILALVVGLVSGLSAVILKNTVHYFYLFLTRGFDTESFNLLYLAYPLIGIALTVLYVRLFVHEDISHGVSKVLYSISRGNSHLKPHNNYSSLISSTITVGFGGSVGLEAPIVLTGASIGSNLARLMRMDYRTMTLMIGCGAAGAIAGIFKAPIAAVVFALEVLMLDLTMASLIPLLISAVTGTTISAFLMGNASIFALNMTSPFDLKNIPFYILLGIIAGLVSLYFARANAYVENKIYNIRKPVRRLLVGGVIVSFLVFLLPPLYGEGYEVLGTFLTGEGNSIVNNSFFYEFRNNQWLFMGFLLMVMFFKVIAMASTTASGGVGGVFAPSLFMGGVTGFLISRLINTIGYHNLPESNFVLAGMAGVMAAVMHAPLTAIFLIAEVTGGYEFFVPLIITSTISYLTINLYEPHSIYAKRLASRGELITHDKDKAVLSRLSIERLIEDNFLPIGPDNTLGDLVKVIARSERNVFPVVDKENNFLGVVFINEIRDIIFDHTLYDKTFVRNLMFMPQNIVHTHDTMESVARVFSESKDYNLPVLENGKYRGFVSRANVFSAYRKLVKEYSQE